MLLQKLKLSFIVLIVLLLYTKESKSIVLDFDNNIQNAKKSYSKEDYKSSFEYFNKLNQKYPKNLNIKYNLANTLYKKGNYEFAEKNFKDIAENKNADQNLRFSSFYNLGNSFYKQNKLDDSEKAYLSALQINPDDIQAKKNLEKVRKEIKKKQKENDELKDKKSKEKNKNNKESNNKKNKNDKDNKKHDNNKLNKDIKKSLNNLDENNKDFIKNQILKNITGNYGIEKDW